MKNRKQKLCLSPLLISILLITVSCKLFSRSSEVGDFSISSSDVGLDRQHPVPIGSLVSVPGWQIGVIEFLRGDDALEILNDTDWPPPAASEGQEYVLAKIFLRSTSTTENSQSLGITNLFITGDQNVAHGDSLDGWPQPEFLYEDMYTAETAEGWVDALVPVDESNFELVLDITTDSGRITRYFELEKNASISLPQKSTSLQPNNAGSQINSPVLVEEKVITADWNLQIVETIRGPQAETLLLEVNPYYPTPSQGEEFLLLHLNLQYISDIDLPISLGPDNFYAIDNSGFQLTAGYLYPPKGETWLSGILLPGANLDVWVPILVPQGVTPILVIFDPDRYNYASGEENVRYFLIE